MANTGLQIANLMMDNNKNAADMTHAVKVLGGGSMQRGFHRIGEFFSREVSLAQKAGLRRGRIQGGLAGMLGTVCVGGIIWLLLADEKDKAAHEKEGRTILQAMETAEAPAAADADRESAVEETPDASPEMIGDASD